MHKKHVDEKSVSEIANCYDELKHKDALLLCQDSRKVSAIPDKVVDTILTDPPYFDNLVYSELADFFYVWLRLLLKEKYNWFKPATSQRMNEIIMNHTRNGSASVFVQSLSRVFRECYRILKDDGMMVFTFHHTKPWAWEGVKKAIENSGFVVTATPVIRSEGRTGYRKGSNISYDVCIVCRKKENSKFVIDNREDSLIRNSIKKVRELYSVDSMLKDTDILTAIMSEYLLSDIESSVDELFNNRTNLLEAVKTQAI